MQIVHHTHHATACGRRIRRVGSIRCKANAGSNSHKQPQTMSTSDLTLSRRQIFMTGATLLLTASATAEAEATEWFGVLAARKILRPDGDEQQALVDLLDAQGTLKEVAELAATPADSQERFFARKYLPGMAKRLRNVAQAAPVVAASISGDKEATLSEKYGGTGQSGSSLTDPVYETIGRVLTISGRTIKPEALASPEPALQAVDSLEKFLASVPQDQLQQAQEFRTKRYSNN